jgi:hypothetical protein
VTSFSKRLDLHENQKLICRSKVAVLAHEDGKIKYVTSGVEMHAEFKDCCNVPFYPPTGKRGACDFIQVLPGYMDMIEMGSLHQASVLYNLRWLVQLVLILSAIIQEAIFTGQNLHLYGRNFNIGKSVQTDQRPV